ncbi:MAG TPA: two pore domain potassium channel family protein, partial [Ignavibacteria bacterium]|nr:two pore domain potassium channel family protein [Ignavibacteria bacterium]
FNHGEKISQLCFSDSLYFSVVTITTLGYGDISPTGGIGKLLTGSEAVFGILILGLFLHSLSHSLAISYQEKLKEKESEIAIKIIYVPNWSEINQYYWGLTDVFKALSKVHLLQQPATDSTQEQLNLFKDSLNLLGFYSPLLAA